MTGIKTAYRKCIFCGKYGSFFSNQRSCELCAPKNKKLKLAKKEARLWDRQVRKWEKDTRQKDPD